MNLPSSVRLLRISFVLGIAAFGFACSEDVVKKPPPPAAATATLLRAHTGDGKVLHAFFDGPVKLAPANVSILADEAAAAVNVVSVENDGTHSAITLAEPLPTGPSYQVKVSGVTKEGGAPVDLKATLHLALIWHQHQPSYVDPQGDWLRGPWVRKHGTKDYFDMAAMVGEFPDIHVQVNLTPILLMQLEDYYLARLRPVVDLAKGTVDAAAYLAQRTAPGVPVTDPWLDMLLEPTPEPAALTAEQRGWFYGDIWSTFSISDVMIARWPAYLALRAKRDTEPDTFTKDDLLQMKGYFQLAWFDPDFLAGPVQMPDGSTVDLSDLVNVDADGKYTLEAPFTEAVCQRLVVEEYKVLSNIVGAHKKLIYDADAKTGQIEVMTTPFFHPILPLLLDGDLARVAMPSSPMPQTRFQEPEDARFHVAQAARTFKLRFGKDVTGMWPAEGSVAEDVVSLLAENHVRSIATDRKVLERSTPPDGSIFTPYRIDADAQAGDGGDSGDELAVVFRDTAISDAIGFQYQGGTPEDNVADLMRSLRKSAPPYGEERLLSVILDGENAWEWYAKDPDAKGFLRGMYAALTDAQTTDEVRTVTVSEYLSGNEARRVAPHPTHDLPELEPLYPASWINGNFDTWIGEDEENLAWDYLDAVRADLQRFEALGMARPALDAAPVKGTPAWYAYKAWYSMYAAEGSDWFWWYGSDQTAAGGDAPFDRIFLEQLKSVYRNAKSYGIDTEVPDFAPILRYCEPPRATLTAAPTIDGKLDPDDGGDPSKPSEWTTAGAGSCVDVDSGATPNPDDVIKAYYHGHDDGAVYLALRMSADAAARLGSVGHVRVYFSQKHIVSLTPEMIEQDELLDHTRTGAPIVMGAGGAARELDVALIDGAPIASIALATGGEWSDTSSIPSVAVAFSGDLLELRVPSTVLHLQTGDPLEMLIVVVKEGRELDRAPNLNALTVVPDRSQLVEVKFVLDATGAKLPLTAVKGIDNPPPPAGTGTAFIVGSLDELANWSPNNVAMADDGSTFGDEVAGDNLWTFRLLLPPLTQINYKYTIGNQGDGWGPTEEYPLTNRGFDVKDADGNGKVVLLDVFADRPDPSGSLPAMTELVDP